MVEASGSRGNPLLSHHKSSQLQAVLHPLVLLTISDYITRHTLRQQDGPIIGALLGQQNGRDITVEHAFECHLRQAPEQDGGYLLNPERFSARLEQMVTVHKDRQLDLVGWYTLLPSSGPSSFILPIHNQILQNFSESAILLGFHPEEVLNHSVGGKLPLTVYESNYEVDDAKSEADGEDKSMDDGEPALKLKFREVPYSVETDETEMISMNYVLAGGGSAAAAGAKEERPARSIETNGKGKRRLVENSDGEEQKAESSPDENTALTREEEELIASLTAKSNAIKMLHARIRLIIAHLQHLPPSYLNPPVQTPEMASPETTSTTDTTDTFNHIKPSLTVLRQIQALVSRLDLVIPSDEAAFAEEMLHETNDVNLISLLNSVMQGVNQARDVGKKFSVVEAAKNVANRRDGPYNMSMGGGGGGGRGGILEGVGGGAGGSSDLF